MLKNKLSRHTTAFLTIALVSVILYPAAQAGSAAITWLLLGFVALAAILTLTTK